jgi:hypothetical protein
MLHVFGWVACAPFLLVAAFVFVAWQTGDLENHDWLATESYEMGFRPFGDGVLHAATFAVWGLPGLAMVLATWWRMRRADRRAASHGFRPILRSEDSRGGSP